MKLIILTGVLSLMVIIALASAATGIYFFNKQFKIRKKMKDVILQKKARVYPAYMLCEFSGLIPKDCIVLQKKIKFRAVCDNLPVNFQREFSDLYEFCKVQGFGIYTIKLQSDLYEINIY